MDFELTTIMSNVAGLLALPWVLAHGGKYRIAGSVFLVGCLLALNLNDTLNRYPTEVAWLRALFATGALSLCGWGIYRIMIRQSRRSFNLKELAHSSWPLRPFLEFTIPRLPRHASEHHVVQPVRQHA